MPLFDLTEFFKLSSALNYNLSATSLNRYNVLMYITDNKRLDDDDDGGNTAEHYGAWDGNYSDFRHSREDDWGTLYFGPPSPTSSASSTWGQIKSKTKE